MTRTQIPTRSGLIFDLANPRPEAIRLSDIVVTLCNIPRFNSQSPRMISVAAHSVALSRLVPQGCLELRAAALLHDAAEAYTGDIIRPVKGLLPADAQVKLETIELGILEAIEAALSVSFCHKLSAVKKYDDELCGFELLELYGMGCINQHFECGTALKTVQDLAALSPREMAFEFLSELLWVSRGERPGAQFSQFAQAFAEVREAGAA